MKVISADQEEIRLPAGKAFTPAIEGWFMGDARYQRYRRAVADKILLQQTKPTAPQNDNK